MSGFTRTGSACLKEEVGEAADVVNAELESLASQSMAMVHAEKLKASDSLLQVMPHGSKRELTAHAGCKLY